MSNKKKERRCKSCGKLLLDEKLFCRRCVLEGRNKVGQVGIVSGLALTVFRLFTLINNNSDGNNDMTA